MRRHAILLVAIAAGCGYGGAGGPDAPTSNDGNLSDATATCTASVFFDPTDMPVYGPGVTVDANGDVFGAIGAVTFSWTVTYRATGEPIPFTPIAPDDRDIRIPIEMPGPYDVTLTLTSDELCLPFSGVIDGRPPGANEVLWRFRVKPGPEVSAPPQEFVELIRGGAPYDIGELHLVDGFSASTMIRNPGGNGVPSYVRFSREGLEIEGFAGVDGMVSVQVPWTSGTALVIPNSENFAPRRFTSWTVGGTLQVDAGTAVTGTVRGPGGAPLPGARVSMKVGGVPSTLATTASDGRYTVRVASTSGPAEITVAAPPGSGLPKLVGTRTNLATTIDATYAASLATPEDVGGTEIRRGGAPAPNARVTFVGTLSNVGTITGVTTVRGEVAITAIANASGILPATLVPARAMSGVILPVPGEAAVVNVPTPVPAFLAAPGMVAMTGNVMGGGAVGGARVTAIPTGTLAIGAAMPVVDVANASGAFSLQVAPGGRYDLVVDDPSLERARVRRANQAPGPVPDIVLPPAMPVTGKVLADNGVAARGASVEALCNVVDCSGIDLQRPQAEAATNITGGFGLALPDPGTSATRVTR